MKFLFTVPRAVCTLCLFELGLGSFFVEASILDMRVLQFAREKTGGAHQLPHPDAPLQAVLEGPDHWLLPV